MSPASLQQIYSILPPTDLSIQHLDMSRCCRQIRCVASKSVRNGSERTNLQQIYSIYNYRRISSVLTAVTSPVTLGLGLRKVGRIFTDNNASRLYEAVLVYLQHDVLEIKQKIIAKASISSFSSCNVRAILF